MKKPASFKVMDIKRAVYAVKSSGVDIARVEIEPGSGKITVVVGKGAEPEPVTMTGWEDYLAEGKVALRS